MESNEKEIELYLKKRSIPSFLSLTSKILLILFFLAVIAISIFIASFWLRAGIISLCLPVFIIIWLNAFYQYKLYPQSGVQIIISQKGMFVSDYLNTNYLGWLEWNEMLNLQVNERNITWNTKRGNQRMIVQIDEVNTSKEELIKWIDSYKK